nr:unnamed protein product [Spirometra erinaceieuropaei]
MGEDGIKLLQQRLAEQIREQNATREAALEGKFRKLPAPVSSKNDRLVQNVSSNELTEEQMQVLRHETSYNTADAKPANIIAAVESVLSQTGATDETKNLIRHQVSSLLMAHRPRDVLSKVERDALKELRADNDLAIDLAIETTELLLREKYDETENRLGHVQIIQILKFCLKTYFTFDGTIYEQVKGTPMGSPISGLMAEAVLQRLESLVLRHHRPKFWARYVDDTFVVIGRDQVLTFKEHLNAVFPDTQFTMEKEEEENNQLACMDVLVCRRDCGDLKNKVFRKATNTTQILNVNSNHWISHKRSCADVDEGFRNPRPPPTNITVNEAPKTPVPTTNGERIQPPEIVVSPGSGGTSPAPPRTPSMTSKPSRTPSIASKTPTETADKPASSYAPTEKANKPASNYGPDEQAGKAVPNKAPPETPTKTGPNYGLSNPHASRTRLPSGSSDKPAPDGIQAMYEHWGGSKTASRESIPRAVGAAGSHPPSISAGGSLAGTEFAEEPYNHNLKWDEGSNFHPLGSRQDKGSVISLASRPGIVTRIKFDFKESVLQIHFGEVSKAPTRANGGASAYQVRIAILMKRKKRWHSKVHNAPDPTINETAVFKDMNLGESHKLGVESDSDLSDSLSRLSGASHRMGSRLSLRSKRSSTSSRSAEAPPQQTVAENVAKSKNANWPELLIGLSYSQQTGRLNITAVKASKLKIPGAPSAIPKTFISVSLMAKTGEKITAAKTKAAHTSCNPEYGEKFSFEVPAVQINNVVLFFRVYHKHKVHKDENIGWFAIGCSNSGSEEEAHWRDMLAASGQEIMRWHTLNEDVR